jgi:hypothetical protein
MFEVACLQNTSERIVYTRTITSLLHQGVHTVHINVRVGWLLRQFSFITISTKQYSIFRTSCTRMYVFTTFHSKFSNNHRVVMARRTEFLLRLVETVICSTLELL